MDEIANIIYEVKEKLTDGEFKSLMDKLKEIKNETTHIYKVWYLRNQLLPEYESDADCKIDVVRMSGYVKLTDEKYNKIEEVIDETGSYAICKGLLSGHLGNDFSDDHDHEPILMKCEDDLKIQYTNCETHITKIEKV